MKITRLIRTSVLSFTLCTLLTSATSFASDDVWRILDQKNTAVLTLPHGKVVIELAPQFAPNHVAQFKSLVQSGHYDGNKFYRVIDGFVAQAGPADGSVADKATPLLKMEGEWPTDETWRFTKIQDNDLFAEQTGFKDGFALAHNPSEQKAWLTHCPGVIAMARSNKPDSASSHFYITNGQAPRYLDRIMTIFGRVVYGMNHVQAITRTAVIEGEERIDEKEFTEVISMRMMNDIPAAQQIRIAVKNTESAQFSQMLAERKKRDNAFFYKKPPPVLDICQTPVQSRLVKD